MTLNIITHYKRSFLINDSELIKFFRWLQTKVAGTTLIYAKEYKRRRQNGNLQFVNEIFLISRGMRAFYFELYYSSDAPELYALTLSFRVVEITIEKETKQKKKKK